MCIVILTNVPANFKSVLAHFFLVSVVAVYALNDEFKSILRETKNGMVSPASYILAKTIMVLPVMYIMSLFALVIPSYVIQGNPWEGFGQSTLLWSVTMYCFECLAECLSAWVEDPIFGMLQALNFWCK